MRDKPFLLTRGSCETGWLFAAPWRQAVPALYALGNGRSRKSSGFIGVSPVLRLDQKTWLQAFPSSGKVSLGLSLSKLRVLLITGIDRSAAAGAFAGGVLLGEMRLLHAINLCGEHRIDVWVRGFGDVVQAVLLRFDQFLIDLRAGLALGKCALRRDNGQRNGDHGKFLHCMLLSVLCDMQ